MSLQFNLNRPPVNDDEINKNKDFDLLVKRFKEQSLKKAQGDESWWKNKKIRYTSVIAGVTVICTITYLSLIQSKSETKTNNNETITTPKITAKKTTSFIQAPVNQLKTPYSKYKVNAQQVGKISHAGKSKITVPKNALVNKEGKELIGEVTLEYKEMHDVGDVMLNGIPMEYDSAGSKLCLETAGMFELRASQNGEAAFIKPGKEIQVELLSQNTQDRFNQYYLDTIKQNWTYLKRDNINLKSGNTLIQKSNPLSSPKLEQLQNESEVILPKKMDSVRVIYTRATNSIIRPIEPRKPEKASGKRPEFVIDASTQDFPELIAYQNTIFEVGNENRNYSKELHEITWNDVKLLPGPIRGKNYILQLSVRNKTEKLVVYPVLKGEDYEKAEEIYEKNYGSYQRLLQARELKEQKLMAELQSKQAQYLALQKQKREELENERTRLQNEIRRQQQTLTVGINNSNTQNTVQRVFQIAQFGIYNSDCPHPRPNQNSIKPVFVLEGKGNLVLPDRVYLIDHGSKTVMGFDMASSQNIFLDTDKMYSFCIFKNGKVFHCSKTEIEMVAKQNKREFKVKPLSNDLENLAQIKRELGI